MGIALNKESSLTDPWAFGWTQLLTIVGFIITIAIAVGGFRTFGRWKRERIEERRMDIIFDVLSIAHEFRFVFDRIRDTHGFVIPSAADHTFDRFGYLVATGREYNAASPAAAS